jgi:hypothetical protein
MQDDFGYIDYFAVLGLDDTCKPGEVRKNYKQEMKNLLIEISRTQITPDKRDKFLLDLAMLNAAFYILRENDLRERFAEDRKRVMALETQWREAVTSAGSNPAVESEAERLRRAYDGAVRHFLSRYLEELPLEAGRDRECVEASHWDMAHERHAGRILRHFRQRRYHEIQERLPFSDVTRPEIDWEERTRTVRAILAQGRA